MIFGLALTVVLISLFFVECDFLLNERSRRC